MFYLSCNTSNQVYTVCLCGDSHSLDQIYICLHLYINFLHLHAISKDPFNTEITWRGPLLWLCFLHSTCGSFQAWPCGIGLSGWYSASCFCWENTRGIFGCLLISSECRAGRQENTHFQAFVKWFPYVNTHMHTGAHTHTQSSLHSPALISSWLSASCYSAGDDTHARTHTHTHTHTHSHGHARAPYAHSRVIHASFQITVLIKRSQKTERKLNKPRRPNEAVGHSFRSNPRDQPPVLFFEYNSGVS